MYFIRCFAFIICFFCQYIDAKQIEVYPADNLQIIIDGANDYDELVLNEGTYAGNFTVYKPLTLRGHGAVVDSGNQGSSIAIKGKDISIVNLQLTSYGSELYEDNSGVLILPGSDNIKIEQVVFRGPGFGVRADNSTRISIIGCDIEGQRNKHVLDRGDGVFLKYVKHAEIHGNTFKFTRDGLYFENTEFTNSTGNRFLGMQYGIHYMYTRNHEASGNHVAGSIGGYAIMSSSNVRLLRNTAERTVEFGVLLNVADKSEVSGNVIRSVHNRRGRPELDNEGKALFVFGKGQNIVRENLFAGSDIGVGVSMGGEGTLLYENAFEDNKLQVRYVGSGSVEWSKDGRGNYWSGYQGWDINGDGIGDAAFQPNDSLDRLFWLYPEARFLMESQVVALLRFLASRFEMDKGKGVTDSYPLMKAPKIGEAA